MKRVNYIILTLALIIILAFPSISVFASVTSKDVSQILNEQSLELSSDNSSVQNILGECAERIKEILELDRVPSFKKESFFKIYKLNETRIVNHYRTNKKFKENITENYSWNVPIVQENTTSDHLATFVKNEKTSEWDMAGFTDGLLSQGYSFLLSKDSILKVLNANNVTTVDDMKFVRSDFYASNIIYILKDNKEYAIPFSNSANFMGFKSGQLYEMETFISTLEKNAPEDKINNATQSEDSTEPIKADNLPSEINLAIVIPISVAVICVVLIIVINKKSIFRKKENTSI